MSDEESTFHCRECHKDFKAPFKRKFPNCGSFYVTEECICKIKKNIKSFGTKYTFEHSSGMIRIDILAAKEDEAREVFVHTVKRPELYSLKSVDVNGMES